MKSDNVGNRLPISIVDPQMTLTKGMIYYIKYGNMNTSQANVFRKTRPILVVSSYGNLDHTNTYMACELTTNPAILDSIPLIVGKHVSFINYTVTSYVQGSKTVRDTAYGSITPDLMELVEYRMIRAITGEYDYEKETRLNDYCRMILDGIVNGTWAFHDREMGATWKGKSVEEIFMAGKFSTRRGSVPSPIIVPVPDVDKTDIIDAPYQNAPTFTNTPFADLSDKFVVDEKSEEVEEVKPDVIPETVEASAVDEGGVTTPEESESTPEPEEKKIVTNLNSTESFEKFFEDRLICTGSSKDVLSQNTVTREYAKFCEATGMTSRGGFLLKQWIHNTKSTKETPIRSYSVLKRFGHKEQVFSGLKLRNIDNYLDVLHDDLNQKAAEEKAAETKENSDKASTSHESTVKVRQKDYRTILREIDPLTIRATISKRHYCTSKKYNLELKKIVDLDYRASNEFIEDCNRYGNRIMSEIFKIRPASIRYRLNIAENFVNANTI